VLVAAVAVLALLAAPAYAVPAGPEPIKNVHYGPGETENGTVFPAPFAGAPTVAFVHGGWCTLQMGEGAEITNHISPTMNKPTMIQIQREYGALVFDIDYPQMNRTHSAYPMEPNAVESAVVWLRDHATEYGGNPNNIVLFGSSCGGWVASTAAEQLQADHPGLLSGAVEWSAPWLDATEFVPELMNAETGPSGAGPTVEMLECHAFVVKTYADCTEEKELEASPVAHIGKCLPWMISWGEVSDFVDKEQSEMFASALEAAGCEVDRSPASSGHAIGYFKQKESALFEFLSAH
jgi:acetyl esterase/lipase